MTQFEQEKELLRMQLFNAVYKAVVENNTAPFIDQLAYDEASRAVTAFNHMFGKGE